VDSIVNASRKEIEELQLERVRWTLNHAYENVLHYRQRFDSLGVHPSDLKTLKDLSRFPFTEKKDLRDNYPYQMFAVAMKDVVRIHASSGTTGKPTVVAYTKRDVDNWSSLVARSIEIAGGTAQDIVQVSYGYGLFTGGLGAHYGAESLGCAVIPMSGGQTEKQVAMIMDLKPSIIMVTPSYMLTILDEMQRQGIDTKTISLRIGIFGAEPWASATKSEIRSRTSMVGVDIYGLSEIMGPGVASESGLTLDGPIVWEDHFYPEIIDPITKEVLPDGEEGELVITTLTKEALPMVRYRTRDLTKLLEPTATSMRRISPIHGRSDDMLIIRGVNVFPTQIEDMIAKVPSLAPQYLLVVDKEGSLDTLEVKVEIRKNASNDAMMRAATELAHHIKSMIGVTAKVTVVNPFEIERTSVGKAKRVLDKRVL
jgi:phenylacetate-CoA ligase